MNKKIRVAGLSVFSNTLLVIFKLIVGIFINSISVLSEAIHSGLDLLAALLALFAVRQSEKPPDEEHQFGHGKFENVAGVVEAILIFVAAVWIIWEAARKLLTGTEVAAPLWGLIVMGVSGGVNLVVSSILMKTARATDSVALEADAWHLRTDVYTSLGVAAGLFLLWLTGFQILDPLIAIGVALLIIKASFDLIAKAFFPLLDTKLPPEEEKIIKEIINRYSPQYVGFHQLRGRKAGSERHIDLHLVVPQNQNIAVSHKLCDEIEKAVHERFTGTHILIHVEPCREGHDCSECPERCELVLDRGNNSERNLP
ncbi:MAG: cation diffusion facilitator family transporter [Bacillota bacterium]|nr:cation diffusion facilitator family transporter [Bacillota bacterium]